MVRINLLFYFLIITVSNSFTQYSNIAVTTNSYDQSEPTIAVSPLNSNIVLAVWNDSRDDNTSKPGFAFSTNAGKTWAEGITLPGNYEHGFDPSVAFDRNGNALYCYIAKDPDHLYGRVYVSRTTTFQPPFDWNTIPVSNITYSQDKPWISVDNTGGTYDGRLYFS